MALVLDAMGSDAHPAPEIEAAITASALFNEEIILTGDEQILKPALEKAAGDKSKVSVVHAPDLLEMGEKAVQSAKAKPQNSMAVGMELIKSGRARAFATAGNTGAAMFVALLKLKRIEGVLRPAMPATFPTAAGKCIVLDIGANVDSRPEFLVQFALMGNIYAKALLKIDKPRVGLLANGEEPGKGNQLVRDTYPLLEATDLNFIGNVEGKEVFGGAVDVVVTDGFAGNVMLKSSEAAAKLLTDTLKSELRSSLRTKLGGLLAKPAFTKLKQMMDPHEIGGVPLLGVDGIVVIGHGRSNAHALVNALKAARDMADLGLVDIIKTALPPTP